MALSNCGGRAKIVLIAGLVIAALLIVNPANAATGCDGAGNCYIYASATGSGTGASWTNAYTGFGTTAGKVNPASMTRGVSYWVAAGSYGGVTFSTAASGTSVITLESPTIANHGPASDWNNSFLGQALFGASSVTTGYWAFNGQTRGSDWRSAYLLKFQNLTNASIGVEIAGVSNVTFEYVEVEGTNGNYSGGDTDFGMQLDGSTSNFYMGHSWLHDSGSDLFEMFTSSNVTFESNMIERNFAGAASGGHSQAFGICGMETMIVRYNFFRDIVNTGVIDTDCAGYNNDSNWYIYGNTDYWTTGVYTGGGGGQADGFIGLFGEIFSGNFQVYNNTFANITSSACSAGTTDCSTTAIFECGSACGGSGCSAGNCGSPTATIYNNIWWNVCNGGNNSVGAGAKWSPTADYGEAYCPSGGCTHNANCSGWGVGGSHDILSNTGNPFVNFDGSTNFNFELTSNTTAGYSTPNSTTTPPGCTSGTNCENVDPLGVLRGANGTIDRGTFQMGSALAPPANLAAVVN